MIDGQLLLTKLNALIYRRRVARLNVPRNRLNSGRRLPSALASCATILAGAIRLAAASEEGTPARDPFAALKPLYKKIEAEVSPRLDDNDFLGAVEASKGWLEEETDAAALAFLYDIRSSYLAAAGLDLEARVSMTRATAINMRWRGSRSYDTGAWAKARRQVLWEEPEAVIRRAAAKHSILMFSEAHHVPETRAFGARILPLLRELGFTVLAMEALKHPVPAGAARVARAQAPEAVSGYYLMEPQMAGLVREARRLGFTLVAYEDETIDGDRELIQARNLYDRILRARPDVKVVIWAGYGHIYKRSPFQSVMMAEHLWKLTGKEPYCLYQVTDALDPLVSDYPFYKPLVLDNPARPRCALVLENRKGLYPTLDAIADSGLDRTEAGDASVDGYIVHPPFAERGPASLRPAWVPRPGLVRIEGNASWKGRDAMLIQAFPAAEGTAATPSDQMLLGEPGPFELHLPRGDYILRARDAAGKARFEERRSAGPGLRWMVELDPAPLPR